MYGYDSIEVLFMKAQKRFFDGKTNDSNKMLTLLAAFHKEADETEQNLEPQRLCSRPVVCNYL